MSTVAERIAALNAKKKAEPAPQPIQRTGVKWQKPTGVETKSPEAGSAGTLSPQGLKTTPSWIKPNSGSVSTPLSKPVSSVMSKTSPLSSSQSSPATPENAVGSSPPIKIPVVSSASATLAKVSNSTAGLATVTNALQEDKPNHIQPKDEPRSISLASESAPREVGAVASGFQCTVAEDEAKVEPSESKHEEGEGPAQQNETAGVEIRPPLPTSRKASLVDSSLPAEVGTLTSTIDVPSNVENTDIQLGLSPQTAMEVGVTQLTGSAAAPPPVVPPSRRPSAPPEEGSPTVVPKEALSSQFEATSSGVEPAPEKATVPLAQPEKPMLTSNGSRRTIRFADAPVIVEYREHQIELGIDESQRDKAEVVSPLSSPPRSNNEEEEDEQDSLVEDDDDEEEEEFTIDERDNESDEARDEDDFKGESKLDPPKPLQSGLRPSLLREGSSDRGSRRSVRFGVGDEVKVEEYNYEDLDRQASEDEPLSSIPPPPPLPVDESPGSEPRRRSSLGERVVSVFKRATGSSSSSKDQKKVINGLSWG